MRVEMSRLIGSESKERPPEIIPANEAERLDYLAALLLEIAEEELQENEAEAALGKIMLLSNATAIAYLENEIDQIHLKITKLEKERQQMKNKKPIDIDRILARVRYFLEHLDSLLLKQQDPHKKAQLFGVLFDQLPTYDAVDYGTQKTPLFTGVNPVFSLLKLEKSLLVNLIESDWNNILMEFRRLYHLMRGLSLA